MFLRNLLINMGGRSAILFLALGTEILVARSFGPVGKGHYAILLFCCSTIHIVFHLGFSRACIYFYQQLYVNPRAVLSLTVFFTVFAGLLFAASAFLFLSIVETNTIFDIPIGSLELLVLFAPFIIGVLALANINRALENFVESNIVQVTNRLGVFAAVGILILFDVSIDSLVFALVAGAFLANTVGWRRLMTRVELSLRNVWNFDLFRKMFSYGLRAASFNIVTLISMRIDHLVIGSVLGLKQLGFYSAAIVLVEFSNKIVVVLTEVMFPKSSALHGDESDKFTALLLRFTVAFSFMFLVIVGIFSNLVINAIFGDQFSESKIVLLVLLPSGLFLNVTLVLGTDLSGRGRPGVVAVASIISVVMIIVGNLLFTARFGIVAAAAVAMVSNFVAMLACLFCHLHLSSNRLQDILIIKKGDWKLIAETMQRVAQSFGRKKA